MAGVQDQEPIQAFRSDRPDEPLGDPIGLGCLNRRPNDSDVFGLEDGIEAVRELAILIADQKANRFRPFGEGPGDLSRLLHDAFGVRVSGAPGQMDTPAPDLDEEQYKRWSQPVSTVKKSTAMMLFACARKNSRHDGPLRVPAGPSCSSRRIFLTVVADTTMPRPFSSPTMR